MVALCPFTWNGEYQDGSFIASSHLAEDRGTGSGGSVDITIGELKPITSEMVQTLSPAMATPIAQTPGNQTGNHSPLTDVLILRDKLTGLEQQRIEVKQVQADSNGTRWTTGDEVAADGQVRAVRLGTYVATAETGALWKLPLQVGTSGSASVRVPGQTARATLDWRVTGKQGDRTTVEGKLLLPANGGTWTLQYQDGVALAVNQSTEFRSPSPKPNDFHRRPTATSAIHRAYRQPWPRRVVVSMDSPEADPVRSLSVRITQWLLAAISAWAFATSSIAGVALVIGNAAYPQSKLDNPGNDARSIAKALGEAGFEVTLALDQTGASMRQSMQAFGEKLAARKQPGVF